MYCPFCGNNNADTINFCGKCGGNLQPYQKKDAPAKSTPPQRQAPTSFLSPGFTPSPRPKAVKQRPALDQKKVQRVALQASLLLLYIGLALLVFLFAFGENSVQLEGDFGRKSDDTMSLTEFCQHLIQGNDRVHPTAASVAVGVAMQALLYATPLFLILAAVGALSEEKRTIPHVVCVIYACLTAIGMAAVAPLSMRWIPHLDQLLAVEATVLVEDISGATLAPLWLFILLLVVWVVATSLLLWLVNKKKVKA